MYYLLLPVQELLVIFEAFLKELIFLAFYLFDVYLITLSGFSFSGISFLLIVFLKSINASLTSLTNFPFFVVCSRSSNLTLFCKGVIYISLSIIKSFNCFFGNILSIRFNSSILLEKFKDFKTLTCFFVWFSKIYSKRECVNLPCSVI